MPTLNRVRKNNTSSGEVSSLFDEEQVVKVKNLQKFEFNPWLLQFKDQRTESTFRTEWSRGFIKSRRTLLIILVFLEVTYFIQYVALLKNDIRDITSLFLLGSMFLPIIPIVVSFVKNSQVLLDATITVCFIINSLGIAWSEVNYNGFVINIGLIVVWLFYLVGFKVLTLVSTIGGVLNILSTALLIVGSPFPKGSGLALLVYISTFVLGVQFSYSRELYARQVNNDRLINRLIFTQRKKVQLQDKKIASEKQKSQDLLRKCFPEVVLEELDTKGIRGISERFNDASIMFARITNLDSSVHLVINNDN